MMVHSRAANRGKKQDKYERYKIASIPVLLLVLVYVRMNPSHQQTPMTIASPAIPGPTNPSAQHSPDASPSRRPAETTSAETTSQPWPEVQLDFVTRSHPFASIMAEPAASNSQSLVGGESNQSIPDNNPAIAGRDQLSEVARELARQPVNYVFKSARQKYVMLGEQVLEEGMPIAPSIHLHGIYDHSLEIGPPTSHASQ